ncbi:MAG: TolC family protein [Paludibacter sp.]|nr:TolC family protein [Bacteroidales bacterium]MCM1068961.1 TolC family protein [Prevotella sp.]MCM1353624.1 TolC family protein [Bacteroides sp.]MCM1442027.1 TolC family protein [Muribaculum sp.]MCM1481517.1 TolC family protein [Paludibacter sp.]
MYNNTKNIQAYKRSAIHSLFAIGILSVLACSLSACGIYGKYARPDNIQADNLYGADIVENTDSATLATLSWREIFSDPYLQKLIECGLQQNADFQSLQLTVQQSQEAYKASKLAFVPGFTFAPQGGYTYNISGSQGTWTYSLPIAMDWEIDLFGKLVNQKRKAQAALLMTQDMRQAAQTQLVANIASLYYQLLMLDAQLIITDSTAIKWRETVRIMQAMKGAGMMNEVSVAQTEATCFAIESSILDLKHSIRDVENALCVILKQAPAHIQRGTLSEQVLPQELQVGVSAQLLANRPDVRQAEHNLEQYFYGEHYARSAMFPTIGIDGSALWNGNFVAAFLGSLTQPIFQHYALKANLEIAKAQYQQALLAFEQALVQAGSDVNNAMRQCITARAKHSLRTQQIQALQQAMEHTQALMTNGSTTYLEVIYAQQSLLEAQTTQLSDWLEEAQGVVALYQALGGGSD